MSSTAMVLSACAQTDPHPVPAAPPVVAAPPPPRPEPLPASGPFRRELAPGLVVAAYDPPAIADAGFSRPDPAALRGTDPRLYVVTIDPATYDLAYLSSLDPASGAPGALRGDAWAERFELSVAFNPGMFEPDGRATGYTRSGAFVSQPQIRRQPLYRAWFVAAPLREGIAPVAVLDRVPPAGEGTYASAAELPSGFVDALGGYGLVVQSLEVLRDGKAVYPPRKNQWSELAFGVDRDGRVVVVFSRWPYEMREFGRRLEALGLGIQGLLHGEGGPEATLVVRVDGVTWLALAGSYETGFSDDSNDRLWALPAVLGARPRR